MTEFRASQLLAVAMEAEAGVDALIQNTAHLFIALQQERIRTGNGRSRRRSHPRSATTDH